MAHLTTAGSAVVSTAEVPVLRAADLRDGTDKVQVFAHAVAHAIESHPRLHAATRVIHQCIEPAAKEALTVYLSGLHEDNEYPLLVLALSSVSSGCVCGCVCVCEGRLCVPDPPL